MRTAETLMEPGEWFIFGVRPHLVCYVVPVALAVTAADSWSSGGPTPAAVAGLAAAVLLGVPIVVERLRASYILTNRRLIIRPTLPGRAPRFVPLAQITTVTVSPQALGSWLRGGSVRVTLTTGATIRIGWTHRAHTFERMVGEQQGILASLVQSNSHAVLAPHLLT